MTGSAATTCITTGGLYINDSISNALQFGAVVLASFGVYSNLSPTPPPPIPQVRVSVAQGGGSQPSEPAADVEDGSFQSSSAQPFTQSSAMKRVFVLPRDKERKFFQRRSSRTIKISITNKTFDKTFIVTDEKPTYTLNVTNIRVHK